MYHMYEFMYFYINIHIYNNSYSINSLVYFFQHYCRVLYFKCLEITVMTEMTGFTGMA